MGCMILFIRKYAYNKLFTEMLSVSMYAIVNIPHPVNNKSSLASINVFISKALSYISIEPIRTVEHKVKR